jgi:hypothetical protein
MYVLRASAVEDGVHPAYVTSTVILVLMFCQGVDPIEPTQRLILYAKLSAVFSEAQAQTLGILLEEIRSVRL